MKRTKKINEKRPGLANVNKVYVWVAEKAFFGGDGTIPSYDPIEIKILDFKKLKIEKRMEGKKRKDCKWCWSCIPLACPILCRSLFESHYTSM